MTDELDRKTPVGPILLEGVRVVLGKPMKLGLARATRYSMGSEARLAWASRVLARTGRGLPLVLCAACTSDALPGKVPLWTGSPTVGGAAARPSETGWPMFRHDPGHSAFSPVAPRHDPALVWNFRTEGEVWSSPAIGADSTVYFGSTDGRVYAVGGGLNAAAAS